MWLLSCLRVSVTIYIGNISITLYGNNIVVLDIKLFRRNLYLKTREGDSFSMHVKIYEFLTPASAYELVIFKFLHRYTSLSLLSHIFFRLFIFNPHERKIKINLIKFL
jgi:hypothetical protein